MIRNVCQTFTCVRHFHGSLHIAFPCPEAQKYQNETHSDKGEASGNFPVEVCNAIEISVSCESIRSGEIFSGAVVIQVAKAINTLLLRRVVTLGNVEDIVEGSGGVPDEMHIPSKAYLAEEYINHKRYLLIQALVDHKGCSTDINRKWLGKIHATHIFRNSCLFRKLQSGTFFPDQKINIGGIEMPIAILGDSAYPFVPVAHEDDTGSLDCSKEQFNYRLSKVQKGGRKRFWAFKGKVLLSTD
nr:uncharacterized protein LOC112543800 [Pelodiscus sinensis]|eukprot:XP_025034584.1 uncharacterized protein LOC112543800 [Pelodiscus sinensis]